MNTNLKNRIETVLCGRRIHTWGKKIGLSRSVSDSLNNGKLPNADRLKPIVRAENVSLTWLIEGVGEQYLVNHCYSDQHCADILQALYDEQWKTHLLVDGFHMAVVMTQHGSYKVGNIDYLYTVVEVVTGPIDAKTLSVIAGQNNDTNTFFVETSIADMQDLYKGNIGTYGLLHAADALLNKARPLKQKESQSFITGNKVAEEKLTYHGGGEVSSDEMATVEELRRLNPQNLTHIRAVIRSLADKTDSETKD